MLHSQGTRRGRGVTVNVLVVAGLGYLMLGFSPELVILVGAAATLGLLLERVELP